MSIYRKFRSFYTEWGWEEIVPSAGSEPSGARPGAVFARDGTSGDFVLAGGYPSVSDLWTFNLSSKTWTQVVSSGAYSGQGVGYADGSGNLLIALSTDWSGSFFSTTTYKIPITTGTKVALTQSGVTGGGGNPAFYADPGNQVLYVSNAGSTNYYVGDGSGNALLSLTQNVSTNTSVRAAYSVGASSPRTTFLQSSNPALYPANNTLYMIAPSVSYTSTWALSTSSIIKYDLTAATGWVQETGVTNNAGAVPMPYYASNWNQFVWCPAEAKFFLFVGATDSSCARVITYDPSSKVLSEALASASSPLYLLGAYDAYSQQRGTAGTVVVSGSDFYFCRVALTGVTNARIWKFRRN